jgi:hypothetical protein
MALLPTLLALGVGVVLGLRWGGSPDNILEWRPRMWQLGLAGVTLLIVSDLAGLTGSGAVALRLVAGALVVGFAVLNVRTGGMVLVIGGIGLNLIVTLINWGMPVSGSALVSAGIVANPSELEGATLSGGREVAHGAWLGFLGDVIPLPWGQVISVGDLLWLAGLSLVVASVMRRYEVRSRGRRGGPSYGASMSALNRGPAPRRGPGLHPSRLPDRRSGRRSGRGTS